MTTLEILRGMRELLADEKRWTRGLFARTASGLPADPPADDAACWCIAGAAFRLTGCSASNPNKPEASEAAWKAVDCVVSCIIDLGLNEGIGRWQDKPERTHAEILQALDRAIALESGAP